MTPAFGRATHMHRLLYIPQDPKIWYEFHCYTPGNFTYQGIPNYSVPGKVYNFTAKVKADLDNHMKRPLAFKQAHPGAQIFVGEFGCSAFTPDADRAAWFQRCYHHWRKLKAHSCVHAWYEYMGWHPTGTSMVKIIKNMRS